jgi:DNA-binding beta-propeller fold protein YncE
MKKPTTVILFVLIISSLYAQPKNWKGKTDNKDGIAYIWNQVDNSKQPSPIEAKNILTIGGEKAKPEYLFSYIPDIDTDDEGNIYVCDQSENKITVLDKKGIFKYAVGREGKGPGDLSRPMSVEAIKDKIYVEDNLNNRISIFNKGGKFDKIVQTKGYNFHLGVDNSGNMYTVFHEEETSKNVVKSFNYQGKELTSFCPATLVLEKGPYGMKWFASNIIDVKDNLVYVLINYPYKIHIYDAGSLKKVITCDSKIVTMPELAVSEFKTITNQITKAEAIKSRVGKMTPFVLNDNRIAVVLCDYGKNYIEKNDQRDFEMVIHLYDKEGYFTGEYLWDWRKKGIIRHIDKMGNIYTDTCAEGIPGVRVWDVNIFYTKDVKITGNKN